MFFNRKVIFAILIVICTCTVIFLGQSHFDARNKQIVENAIKSQKIAKEKLINQANGKSIYFQKGEDFITVRNKYSKDNDVDVKWGKNGANSLFNFIGIGFTPNTDSIVSYDQFNSPNFSTSTDFFGPHIVLAKNNIDGEKPSSQDFTGGNHAFNGDASGKPTARTTEIKFFVDGKEVKGDLTGYANDVTVEWTNRVQASNTKKSDGSGREVLEEHYQLNNDGKIYKVNAQISFLEDVHWKTYYGIQAEYGNMWDKNISFSDEGILSASKNNVSKKKLTDTITLNNGTDWLTMGINNNVGIGKRQYMKNPPGAFNVSEYAKAYFWLIDRANFNKGDVVNYSGYYRFYNK
jgi:hypothetical protein